MLSTTERLMPNSYSTWWLGWSSIGLWWSIGAFRHTTIGLSSPHESDFLRFSPTKGPLALVAPCHGSFDEAAESHATAIVLTTLHHCPHEYLSSDATVVMPQPMNNLVGILLSLGQYITLET